MPVMQAADESWIDVKLHEQFGRYVAKTTYVRARSEAGTINPEPYGLRPGTLDTSHVHILHSRCPEA